MRTILIHSDVKGVDKFSEILSTEIINFNVSLSIDNIELDSVEVVIIWLHAPSYLSKLPNLKLLLICGSGIDHIVNSPNLPHHIPTVRLVDPFLRNRVADYVIDHIPRHFFPSFNYPNQETNKVEVPEITERKKTKVGIMGLGLIGETISKKLLNIGFEVCGWVRTSRPRFIKEVYVGAKELKGFVENCEVLVCQLPLTKDTRGILNSHLFNIMPKGAYLINVGRGGHLIEADLLPAIESSKLSGACLDVFEVEPLPSDHSFHSNPKITVTPHIAGYVGPDTQAPYAVQVISHYYQNKKIEGMVNYQNYY